MLQHLWWSLFPLFKPLLPDFLWEIRWGRCSYTYSLQQQAQHPRTVNNPGTSKLRTNLTLPLSHHFFNTFSLKFSWFCSTFSTHMVQWGAVQDASFTPWCLKAVRKFHADLYHHKAHCSHTPGFSHSVWHSPPCTAYLCMHYWSNCYCSWH